MLSQGISLKVVQERMGHASVATTGDIYGHLLPTMQPVNGQRFTGARNGKRMAKRGFGPLRAPEITMV
jgi:integrase